MIRCDPFSFKLNLRILILKQGMIFVDLLAKSIGHLGPFDDRFSRIHNPAKVILDLGDVHDRNSNILGVSVSFKNNRKMRSEMGDARFVF
jgi:hypothetical protein